MKFLTFLNYGCFDICKNMLKSAELVGIDSDDFYIACLDDKTLEGFSSYKNAFLYTNQNIIEYQDWTFNNDSGFRQIVKNKWKIIKKIYEIEKNLCFVDSDIVFIKNPISLLENNEKILFQSDSPPYGSYICSGFMVMNETKKCQELIDECASFDDSDDQLIVNKIAPLKYKENIEILEESLFPNGKVYYEKGIKSQAYIVHNNWMVGIENKINKFKEENLWFI